MQAYTKHVISDITQVSTSVPAYSGFVRIGTQTEYRPYTGGNPASSDRAILCAIGSSKLFNVALYCTVVKFLASHLWYDHRCDGHSGKEVIDDITPVVFRQPQKNRHVIRKSSLDGAPLLPTVRLQLCLSAQVHMPRRVNPPALPPTVIRSLTAVLCR